MRAALAYLELAYRLLRVWRRLPLTVSGDVAQDVATALRPGRRMSVTTWAQIGALIGAFDGER